MKVLELNKAWHDQFLGLAAELKFDKRDPVDLNRIALYGTILEFTSGLVTLAENNQRAGIAPLFRSYLEAAVELKNLMADPDYINFMNASNAEQWRRMLKEAAETENPFVQPFREMENLGDELAKQEGSLADLRKAGFAPLSVFARFERAEMLNEYRTIYNSLSCEAHSNIRALMTRHLEFDEDDYTVVFYKDEPLEAFTRFFDSSAALLHQLTVGIHECFQSDHVDSIKGLECELEEVRKEYTR